MRVDCSTWRSNMLPCYFLCTQFTRLVSKEGKNLPENKRPAEYNRLVPDKMLDTYKYVNCIPVNHSHTNQAAIQYRVNHILDCKCLSNACNTHYDALTCKFIGSAEEGHSIPGARHKVNKLYGPKRIWGLIQLSIIIFYSSSLPYPLTLAMWRSGHHLETSIWILIRENSISVPTSYIPINIIQDILHDNCGSPSSGFIWIL